MSFETFLPTPTAQKKIFFLSRVSASARARIPAYTFSKTRGTLQMKWGWTSGRFSRSRSMLSANAVVRPR